MIGVPLMAAAYLPPIAWVAMLVDKDVAQVEVQETFPKQTYRSRAEIMTAQGVRTLSVPVVRHNHSLTAEVEIDYTTRWQTIHLRTLTAAYATSPFFLYYQDALEALLTTHYHRLIDLDMATTSWLLSVLKIDCKLNLTCDWQPLQGAPNDYRTFFSPKKPLPATWFKPYYQVFSDRIAFVHNLSALDLLMNLGPEATGYVRQLGEAMLRGN